MDILSVSRLLVILIDFIGILLILLVYLADKKSKLNRLFCVMTLLALIWITSALISDNPSQLHNALIWNRFVYFILALFFFTTFLFSFLFPKEQKRYPIWERIMFFLSVGIAFSSLFTPLVIKDVRPTNWGTDLVWGSFFPTFAALGMVWLLSLVILFKRLSSLSQREKIQTQYFFFGFSIFFIMNIIFNVIFPAVRGTYEFYQFGNFSIIFFLAFTAYAIISKQLFGIKLILTETLVGTLLIVLFFQIFTAQTLSWRILNGIIFVLSCVFGYLLIKSVIQEIKRRVEIQRLYEEVDRLSKAKSEFLSIASHQLRTPLTAIKGYVSMLLEGSYGKIPKTVEEKLDRVYQVNEKLISFISDLLNVSRIERGKLELQLEKGRLEDIISAEVDELQLKAEQKGLYLKWQKSQGKLPELNIDVGKIKQVVANLIDNAIKYTEKGGVTVDLKHLDGKLQVSVSDTGFGMDSKEINKLFESFSRGSAGTQMDHEGLGIGLYIARKFMELHNGRLWAESEGKGKGSTFFIELPVK
ncbi:MAG: HAMP domain-containing sensor histidine kinase [Patescibacteria group bacterium]